MITYIVACYFGPRRVHDSVYEADPGIYIKAHLEQLRKLKHDVGKIRFIINDNGTWPEGLASEFANAYEDGLDVDSRIRDNVGMSYGAWNYGINRFCDDDEYAFLIEDDYIPVIDNFDQIFLDQFQNNIGYVCSLYKWGHAAISNGIVKTACIKDIGRIPHSSNADYGSNEQLGQVGMSSLIESKGWGIADIAEEYSVPFLDAHGGIISYGKLGGARVISPVILERDGKYTPVQS